MDIQPIVIGTAGHIDHGKSSLVQRLTGIDPDRWEEEKERGMTIDLGFARMELEDGRVVGLVDVPGHERFIRNMVAGASGIDMVVLVVAADDAVMPQTREHLSIMELLGVSRGFVALTKIDIVEEDLVELAAEDIRETVQGTFLEGAPILPVSSITGQGLDELRALLLSMASETEPRAADGVFRMPIQRVFSARGFGTIVTGIPVAGSVSVGETLEVLPSGSKGKVRGIQAYHEKTETARAGHSTAINLSDVDHHTVSRGDVAATPGFFQPVRMVGARLTVVRDLDRPVTNRMPVRVHTGTADAVGEIVVLEHERIEPGATGLVQFRLEHELVCAPGDRFVVRLASPMITLGGGVILEESRYRLKRFKGFVLDELERQEQSLGDPAELLCATLLRAPERWLSTDDLAHVIKRSSKETTALLEGLVSAERVYGFASGPRWMHLEVLEQCLGQVLAMIRTWFEENPLRQVIDVRDVRAATQLETNLMSALLTLLRERGQVESEAGGKLRLPGRKLELDPETERLAAAVRQVLEKARMQPPSLDELCEAVGAPARTLEPVLKLLVDGGEARHLGGELFMSAAAVAEAQAAVEENCAAHGQLQIPALRDRLGTTRKYLIPLLEYFDSVGVTLRQGGHRILKRR